MEKAVLPMYGMLCAIPVYRTVPYLLLPASGFGLLKVHSLCGDTMADPPTLGNCPSFVEGLSVAHAMENPALLDANIEVTWYQLYMFFFTCSIQSAHWSCLRRQWLECSSFKRNLRVRRAWTADHSQLKVRGM